MIYQLFYAYIVVILLRLEMLIRLNGTCVSSLSADVNAPCEVNFFSFLKQLSHFFGNILSQIFNFH